MQHTIAREGCCWVVSAGVTTRPGRLALMKCPVQVSVRQFRQWGRIILILVLTFS